MILVVVGRGRPGGEGGGVGGGGEKRVEGIVC